MEFLIVYVLLAIVVGVAANARGRSGGGWFLLAIVISPIIAGLLVLVMNRVSPPNVFTPDGVHAGVPYRRTRDGGVLALLGGQRVKFKTPADFKAAVDGPAAQAPRQA